MFLKIFKFIIDDFYKLSQFFEKNRLIHFKIDDDELIFKINLIEKLNNNYLRIQYDFTNELKVNNFNTVLSMQSNIMYFQIDSTFYSIFSKFIHNLEIVLKNNDIDIRFENLVFEREKIWNFIENSYQILNLEIMTEKGLIELPEDNSLDFSKFKFKLKEYPISWAQLVFRTADISFQFHFYINEINLPDDLKIEDLIGFFDYFEGYMKH